MNTKIAIDVDEVLVHFLKPMAKWKGVALPKQPKYNYEGKMNLLCLLDQRKTLSDMSALLGTVSYNSAYVILLLGILTSLLPSKYNAFNNNIIRHFSIILLNISANTNHKFLRNSVTILLNSEGFSKCTL